MEGGNLFRRRKNKFEIGNEGGKSEERTDGSEVDPRCSKRYCLVCFVNTAEKVQYCVHRAGKKEGEPTVAYRTCVHNCRENRIRRPP